MVPKTLLGLLLAAATPLATADVLLIDGLERSLRSAEQRPSRGMTMQRVEARYGAPIRRAAPAGAPPHPPITRWEYPDFIVYFEHQHVIHTVTRRTTDTVAQR
jgi:hypothetical protein